MQNSISFATDFKHKIVKNANFFHGVEPFSAAENRRLY